MYESYSHDLPRIGDRLRSMTRQVTTLADGDDKNKPREINTGEIESEMANLALINEQVKKESNTREGGRQTPTDAVVPSFMKTDILPQRPATAKNSKPSYVFQTLTREYVDYIKEPK